jgi:hypothetical protein
LECQFPAPPWRDGFLIGFLPIISAAGLSQAGSKPGISTDQISAFEP